jgi:hypothetical protein
VLNRKVYILANFLNLEAIKMKQLIKPAYEVKVNSPYTLSYDKLTREALRLGYETFKDNKAAIPSTVNINHRGIVKASNWYFANIIANNISKITGRRIHPMNAREVQLFLKYKLLQDASKTYDDEGFVFYPAITLNPNTHEHILEQLQSDEFRNRFNVDLKKPFLLTSSVNVFPDDNYENGLRVDLDEYSEVYNHDSLIKGGRFDLNDSGLIKDGLPGELGKGSKNLYTVKDGVRWFCRLGDLLLYAGSAALAGSCGAGRVRLVENFSSENEGLITKFEEEKQKQIQDLEERVQEKIKQIQSITL